MGQNGIIGEQNSFIYLIRYAIIRSNFYPYGIQSLWFRDRRQELAFRISKHFREYHKGRNPQEEAFIWKTADAKCLSGRLKYQ